MWRLKELAACVFGAASTMGNKQTKPKPGKASQNASIARSGKSGVLALSRQQLKDIPPQVYDLPNLRFIDFSGNQLKQLRRDFGAKFVTLQRLSLADNLVSVRAAFSVHVIWRCAEFMAVERLFLVWTL